MLGLTYKSGSNDNTNNKNTDGQGSSPSGLEYFGLLVSFYWTQQVFMNVSHVTTAGAIASWWFIGDTVGVVTGSLKRALTTSFGSICFGSLLVAILKALRQMAREARKRGGYGACIAQCILGCIERLIEWFNKWAFVYVGIYGYGFKKAGASVFQLFKSRGWTALINDDLIDNTLVLCSVMIGALCAGIGCLGVFAEVYSFSVDKKEVYIIMAIIGFLVGFSTALIVMSVIDSSVCTIFVCFADDPAALQNTHPEEYSEILQAWTTFHPHHVNHINYQ